MNDIVMPDPKTMFPARLDFETSRKRGPYVDGDTTIFKVKVPKLSITVDDLWVRYLGVNTKEVNRADQRDEGLKSHEFVKAWLIGVQGKGRDPFLLDIWNKDPFGRQLCFIWDAFAKECINYLLVDEGYSEWIAPYAMMSASYWNRVGKMEVTPVGAR